jgi:predicted extracellular nuclease
VFTPWDHLLFVIGVHFDSNGGDDPLCGCRQPPVLESEAQRIAQAQVVRAFVDALLTAASDSAVIVLRDLNDFRSPHWSRH